MAQNAANHLIWMLAISKEHKEDLGSIRHWNNLKMGVDGDTIWVRDFTTSQIASIEVKTIPFKSVYYVKDNKLFPMGSGLPVGNAPALLWTPINRSLPVDFPSLNHHFFGFEAPLNIRLITSEADYPAFAVMAKLEDLGAYIQTAPAVRLQHLDWTILGEAYALILGSPLVPVTGAVFWQKKNFLIPAGYDFELPFLEKSISEGINPDQKNWVLWHNDGTYTLIDKQAARPLSAGAFRLSIL